MFEKLRSFFRKKEIEPEDPLEGVNEFQKEVGDSIYPLLLRFFQHKKNPPDNVDPKDWARIKDSILWSFASLRQEKGYINKHKNEQYREKIKKGLILFGRHIDNFKL